MKRNHSLSRRSALGLLAAGVPAIAAARLTPQATSIPAIQSGLFSGSRESLAAYKVPEWFRDAKFGIWAHWGPQSAPEQGDWYARNMYIQGSAQYKYHMEHLRASQSKFGFKDVDPDLEGREVRPRAPDGALQEGRREILRQHGRPPRQLRHVELQAHALERGATWGRRRTSWGCSARRRGSTG